MTTWINTTMKNDHYLIRGQRIHNQLDKFVLCEQSTFSDLEQNVLNFIPVSAKRQNAIDPVRIVKLELLPFIGTKNLNVIGLASSDGTNYNTSIIFNNVEFSNENLPDNVTFTAKDGEEYNMNAIHLTAHTCRVRCNCLDFYYRFSYFNAKDKSLIGRAPKPYQKVQGSNRGPVNPKQVPGVCKHLLSLVKALNHAGIVNY